MKKVTGTRPGLNQDGTLSPRDFRTRGRLLEAAGRVFSEKGYDRATAREICELAEVNPAAVNYHFGGKEQLYVEAVREGDSRLVDRRAIMTILEGDEEPKEKLERFFSAILHSLLNSEPGAWYAKLFVREMAAPTRAFQEVFEHRVRPSMLEFRKFVAGVMDLPADHRAVIRSAASAMSQCMFFFQNRQIIETFLPELCIQSTSVDDLARHVAVFTLGGFLAVARNVKDERGA